MKIGFLSVFYFGSTIGGVENHIYFMTQELKNAGNDVIIFQPIEKGKIKQKEIEKEGIKIVYIPIQTPGLIRYLNKFNGSRMIGFLTAFINKAKYIFSYRKIAKTIMGYNCDIIHQHDFISNLFTTKYLSKKGIPCFLTNHTGEYLFFIKSKLGKFLLKKMLSHYKAIIGPSKELTPHEYHQNSITIYNGVNSQVFYEMPEENKLNIRHEYGFSPEDILVFCPRRWAPTKGIIYLIQSVISYDFPIRYKFLFAGSDYDGYPGYVEKIEELLSNSSKQSQIIRLGNLEVEEMNKMYNISDLVIIPSLMEAVSLAALEAMATGTPVISTNVGGMPELIKHKINGYLINPESPREIYDAIMAFQEDQFYREIKSSSLETAKNFSWKSIAVQTYQLYKTVLNNQ
ncbi:MAG: glycosyltransferase family 4 protein [Calditrichia bacterium]